MIKMMIKSILLFSLMSVFMFLTTGSAMGEKILKIIPHADLKNLDPIWSYCQMWCMGTLNQAAIS